MSAIRSPDFPGERLLVCLNPRLRAERARKRGELLRGRGAINRRKWAQSDGIYVMRTSLVEEEVGAEAAVEAHKSLAGVERAFRTSKDHLRIRPIHVYSENHVRGHVFLCMLAYYMEWHRRRRLAPLLFQGDDQAAARARRDTPVEPAQVSERARRKAVTKPTREGFPVMRAAVAPAKHSTV